MSVTAGLRRDCKSLPSWVRFLLLTLERAEASSLYPWLAQAICKVHPSCNPVPHGLVCYWLGTLAFTQEKRVQFPPRLRRLLNTIVEPMASPERGGDQQISERMHTFCATQCDLGQTVKISPCHGVWSGFNSRRSRWRSEANLIKHLGLGPSSNWQVGSLLRSKMQVRILPGQRKN
jgi:hypothetical protein